jgi:hypothetical protein
MLEIIAWIVGVYFFLVFAVAPFLLPHLRRVRMPSRIPEDLRKTAVRLSEEHPDDLAFLRAVLEEVKERYVVTRRQHFTKPWILFRTDLSLLWHAQRGDNQACHVLNFLVKAILVASGRFTDGEVEGHVVFYHLNIHQYLRVKIAGNMIAVDPWGHLAGKTELGEYAAMFSKRGVPAGSVTTPVPAPARTNKTA